MKCIWMCLLLAASASVRGLETPVVLEPVDHTQSVVFCPHFSWEATADMDTVCEIQIAKDAAFKTLVDSDSIAAMTGWYVCEKKLEPGTYYWRIRFDEGAWSEVRELNISKPRKTLRVSPDMELRAMEKIFQTLENDPHDVLLEFEKGTYRFKPDFEEALIEFDAGSNVIIEGNGSTFVALEPSAPFWKISNSTNVVLSGVKYQYDPLQGSYVKILSIDLEAGTMEAEVLTGFDEARYPREVNGMICYAVDPDNPHLLHQNRPDHTYLDPNRTEKIGDHRYRYFIPDERQKVSFGELQVNDHLIITYRRWPVGLVFRCSNFMFYKVENLGAEATMFMGGGNTDMKIIDYISRSITPPLPGCSWVTGNDRRGPWVENCVFDTLSDDGPNITGNAYLINKVIDDSTFDLSTLPGWQDAEWRPGDRLLFWNTQTGKVIGETEVAEVVSEEITNGFLVSCQSKIIRTTQKMKGLNPGKDIKRNTQVYNLSSQNAGFVARNNRIVNGRRFGFLVKALNSVIEKNHFERLAASAVFAVPFPTQWEGLVARNMIIQDNVMISCGDSYISARVIRGGSGVHVDLNSQWAGHENILIRRNRIVDWEKYGIRVDNVRNVRIEENRFENRTKTGFLIDDNCAIFVGPNARSVEIEGNHYSDERRYREIKLD